MVLCTYCKKPHSSEACPLYAKAQALMRSVPKLTSRTFTTNPPAPFVGHVGYPRVSVGVLAPGSVIDNAAYHDAPQSWSRDNVQISDLVSLRASLIHSKHQGHIRRQSFAMHVAQEVALASRPAELEVGLKRLPSSARLQFDQYTSPMGPSAFVQSLRVTSNVKIPKVVDTVVSEKHKAGDAVNILHTKGVDENRITKILSVGLLGKHPKLVPTRWSITATDDMLSKKLLETVRGNPHINNYQVYAGEYLGNHYYILYIPASFGYELFETSVAGYRAGTPIPPYSYDWEVYEGRKTYATSTAGGYYTVRLAIAEHMKRLKRQGTAIVFRFITSEYTVPMGVWVTREAARRALTKKPILFDSKGAAMQYLRDVVMRSFDYPLDQLVQKSIYFRRHTTQHRLSDFA